MEEGHSIIADYVLASADLENYLQQNGAVTLSQEQAILTTLEITRTSLGRWKRKRLLTGSGETPRE